MPKFEQTSCSQCCCDLGPGDAGVSHCEDHAAKRTPGEEGGSAFPYASTGYGGTMGMSLRDYFAAKAMQALYNEAVISDIAKTNSNPYIAFDALARDAYRMAEAMLAAREAA